MLISLLLLTASVQAAEPRWVCLKDGKEVPTSGVDSDDRRTACGNLGGSWETRKEKAPEPAPAAPAADPAPAKPSSGGGGGW